MSNWNYSEEQLRRWTPRPPSPEVRARLFGRQPLVQTAARTFSDLSRWLVPALGCFLLVVGSLSQRFPNQAFLRAETNLLGAGSGGNNRIIMAELRKHTEINAIPVKHMEYSLGRSLSQPKPSVISYTNQLIQQ